MSPVVWNERDRRLAMQRAASIDIERVRPAARPCPHCTGRRSTRPIEWAFLITAVLLVVAWACFLAAILVTVTA